MTRKKQQHSQVTPSSVTKEAPHVQTMQRKAFLSTPIGKILPYLLSFVCLTIFSTFTYGEVFTRSVQESYIASDAELMKHLTDQEYGQLYIWGRYLLLMFHNSWIGGLLFSLILTAAGVFLDYALLIPKWLRGISTLIPFAFLLHIVTQGINLYYRNEPSVFILQTVGLFIVAALLAVLSKIFMGKRPQPVSAPASKSWKRWSIGTILVVLTYIPLQVYTNKYADNTILTAKMQNALLRDDISTLVECGTQAHQPSRAVAAYYAIGLLQSNQLLENLFDISFNFPKIKLETSDNSGEYGIFNADCHFYAGLINASYRNAMDQIVMGGHRLYYFKRMALCAILNQEKDLANKYLNIISKVPFESDFVEKFQPMVENPDLIEQSPILSKIVTLYPIEERFEQNYRTPAFLGYNVAMMQGTNSALAPSIAACLYSKDLPNMALRAYQYKRHAGSLPMSVMEALSIHARKNPELYQYFPELNDKGKPFSSPANINVNNFYLTIQQFFVEKYKNAPDWREKMSYDLKNGVSDDIREKLYPDWKGHYVYYYYCENVATPKEEKDNEHRGVN